MVLFIKHIDIEGPGTIAEFLEDNKISYTIIDVSTGDKFPPLKKSLQTVVSLGGPMNVYEEEKFTYLAEEDVFLKQVIKTETPFLGVCLGSQLIVKALGGKVTQNPQKEIGWYTITVTEEGIKDELFSGLPEQFPVYQWHGDSFEIPEGGVCLASSELCKNQALKYGRNIYGIQFHVEVTAEMITQWADAYRDELESLKGIVSDKQKMLEDSTIFSKEYIKHAERFYANFFKTAGLLKKKFISCS